MTSVLFARRLTRRARGLVREQLAALRWAAEPSIPAASAVFVYAGDVELLYQARQWLWPLEQLHHRLVRNGELGVRVVCRSATAAAALGRETALPVVLRRGVDELLRELSGSVRLALYPNQATLNFQALAAPGPAHVHLSHGESEKISMVSNQLKAYDCVFTGGEAARERIARRLVGLDPSRLHDVGRPQLDAPRHVPADVGPFRGRTVLYAPTWEGDRPEMSYSSVAASGPRIVQDLIAAGERVIYRPHPQLGRYSDRHRHADRTIRRLLSGGLVQHHVDLGVEFGWQLDAADALVVDMSAVAFDALTAGKPLALAAPDQGADLTAGGLFSHLPVLGPEGTGALAALDRAGTQEAADSRASLAEYHFGDVTPGAQISRFVQACVDTLHGRERTLRRRAASEQA